MKIREIKTLRWETDTHAWRGSLFTLHSFSSQLFQERRVFVQTLSWDKKPELRRKAKRKAECGTARVIYIVR